MAQIYQDIIRSRRQNKDQVPSKDMLWHLMKSAYKDGTLVPNKEIAHMMIGLLMAGQHSSSVTSAWITIRLASHPEVIEELYQEQLSNLVPPLTSEDLARLPLNSQVVKETLRLHPPIHSIMRKVKTPMPVPGTSFTVPDSHVLLAAPRTMSRDAQHFHNPTEWNPHRWARYTTQIRSGEDDEEKIDFGYGQVSKGVSSPSFRLAGGGMAALASNLRIYNSRPSRH